MIRNDRRQEDMVIPDLSFDEKDLNAQKLAIPSVADRLLAFLIDFLVFTPVFSVATAGLLKRLRTELILRPDSQESWALWASIVFSWALMIVLTESIFVCFWRGTPGQKAMKIEVVPFPRSSARMDLMQSFGRSLVHWLGILAVLPLFAVYTHPLRRSIQDRAFDTILITKKKVGESGPLPMEKSFFESWSRLTALMAAMVLLGLGLGIRKSYETALAPEAAASARCEDLDGSWRGADRLDRATGLFLAGTISASCLEKEANIVLWKQSGAFRSFAELAKGLLNPDDELSQSYLQKVCETDAKSEACSISRFVLSKDARRGDLLRRKGLATFTARLLLVREAVDREQFGSAAALIADLRQEALFDDYLAREEIRNVWKIQKRSQGRSPASSEMTDILKAFEERYELE